MRLKRYIFIFLTCCVLLGSCERNNNSGSLDEYISFVTKLKNDAWGDDARARGTNNSTRSNQIGGTPITVGVMAFNSGADDFDEAVHRPNMMNNMLLTKNNSTGEWESDMDVFWPGPNSKSSFFAYSPYISNDNGLTLSDSDYVGVPTVTYKMPLLVENQPRLMLSASRTNLIQTEPVYLVLSHAVAAVGFNLRGEGEKITKIVIKGVVDGGVVPMVSPAVWRFDDVPIEPLPLYEIGLKKDAGSTAGTFKDYVTATQTKTNITKTSGYLMVIPQIHTSSAKIVISVDDTDITFNLKLPEQTAQWSAGKIYMYSIDFTSGSSSLVEAKITLDIMPWEVDNTSNPEVII